jgi:hypothetical protein
MERERAFAEFARSSGRILNVVPQPLCLKSSIKILSIDIKINIHEEKERYIKGIGSYAWGTLGDIPLVR